MQVILLKDINKVGRKGEVKNVADGYALNYLLPNKLATRATADKIKQLEERLSKGKQLRERELKLKREIMDKIKDLTVEIEAKVSDSGKLFAGIKQADIKEKIKALKKVELAEEHILLKKHLKEIGEHQVEIDLGSGLKTQILVKIKPIK